MILGPPVVNRVINTPHRYAKGDLSVRTVCARVGAKMGVSAAQERAIAVHLINAIPTLNGVANPVALIRLTAPLGKLA